MKAQKILAASLMIAAAAHGYAASGSNPKGKPFIAIDNQIIEVKGAISNLEDQVEELVAKTDTLEARVTANENAISALETENQVLQTLISQNTTDIASIQALITDLEYENDRLATQIASNIGDIALLQAEMDANTSLISTLQAAIIALQGDLANIGSDITDLQAQIDNNSALINYLQGQIVNINNLLEAKQNVITGSCPVGWSIREIYPSGGVVCEFDNSGASRVYRSTVSVLAPWVGPGQFQEAVANCPTGYTVTGGGHHMHGQWTQESRPWGNGWRVLTYNNGTFPDLIVYAVCIRVM